MTYENYDSNEGMLTTVWGPPMWHTLHIISFNYPVHPTKKQKKEYYDYYNSMKYILPCGKYISRLVYNGYFIFLYNIGKVFRWDWTRFK